MANFKEAKKYHFIYKTTSLLNNKYYIGMHSTSNIKDGYLGSGKHLRYSIRKYGKENFKCEILEFLPDFDSLKKREKELVNEDMLKDPMCMNLKPGGVGGFNSDAAKRGRIKTDEVLCKKYGPDFKQIIFRKFYDNLTKEERVFLNKKIIDGQIKSGFDFGSTMRGKKHKKESKSKIGLANSIKQKGNFNSQFGTVWITNGFENKKIKKTEVLPAGFSFGRKILKK